MLDRARTGPVTWISGPPGAGKTTLVASYLDARRLRGLWYQLDAGDADPAAFFYDLGLAAAQAAPTARRSLPLLTPEYLGGLPAFTRRYFQELFRRLEPPFVVVLDNYQDVPAGSKLHDVLREALLQVPDGGHVVLISRGPPPPALARLRASGALALVDAGALRLSAEETARLIRLRGRGRLPAAASRRLHRLADGWAAGLVLMLEQAGSTGREQRALGRRAPEAVFDYFAGELFERLGRTTREVLLATAFLPRMTARMAEALTGRPAAGRILAGLSRRNYFTANHGDGEPVYQYHPLFRAFLLARARASFSPARLAAVQRAAAGLLEETGRVDEAAGLLAEAGDLPGLARLIRTWAAAFLEQGRWRTVQEWLERLPPGAYEHDPWLLYWRGACRLPVAPGESLPDFERAFDRLRAAGDRAGALLAWSGAAESVLYERGNFTRLDRWIAALEALLEKDPGFPSREIEARVTAAMFAALAFRQPQHPEIGRWAERARALAQASRDPGIRIQAHAHLALHAFWTGEVARAEAELDRLEELGRARGCSPVVQLVRARVEAIARWYSGAVEPCLRTVSEGLALALTSGARGMDHELLAQAVYGTLSAGKLGAAREFLGRLRAALDSRRLMDVSHHAYLSAWEALLRGDLPRAGALAAEALRTAIEIGMPFAVALTHHATALVLHEQGERAAAAGHLGRTLEIGRQMRSRLLEFMCSLARAEFALAAGDEAAGLAALREAMALGRRQGLLNTPWWRPQVMARLCARALEHGIEVEYVRRLVRTRGLVPDAPPLDVEPWPWPIRIVTLGRFELLRDGVPVGSGGKAQRKPLALLKALVALGGRQVREERLTEALWPDADGAAALQALAITLHRLRRLLGCEPAIRRQEGRVSLDPRYCWVDAWAFEHLAGRGGSRSIPSAEQALALYQGPFLATDPDEPWALAMRERLRSRWLRLLDELGRHWEQAGAWEKAIDCYRKGLDVDECAEEVYRRLMGLYLRLGRRAEALAVYRRCRTVLAAELGVPPSPETEALHQAARVGQALPPRLRLA